MHKTKKDTAVNRFRLPLYIALTILALLLVGMQFGILKFASAEMKTLRKIEKSLGIVEPHFGYRIEEDFGIGFKKNWKSSQYVGERRISMDIHDSETVKHVMSVLDNNPDWERVAAGPFTNFINVKQRTCVLWLETSAKPGALHIASVSDEECADQLPIYNLGLFTNMLGRTEISISKGQAVEWLADPLHDLTIKGFNGNDEIFSKELSRHKSVFSFKFESPGSYTWKIQSSGENGYDSGRINVIE